VLTVFAADSFTLPIPPDIALLIVAHGPRAEAWHWVVPLLGAVSMFGGFVSYGIGSRLAALPALVRLKRVLSGRHAALVRRYGWGAVALGAVTPLPFSITCYAAGALRIPLRGFVFACALRIPRFFVYYAVFASAAGISG
jgi:membrane protein YqaA with SNARE-associated domain